MPYITVRRMSPTHQINFEDILRGEVDLPRDAASFRTPFTVTRYVDQPSADLLQRTDVSGMIRALSEFNQIHDDLFKVERSKLYHTFYLPKRRGGLRRIDEPLPELMEALRQLKSIFEIKMGALYHTSAFAYVQLRSALDAMKRHQANESKWFLKTDFSNFFGSTTEDFVFDSLSTIFPFSEIVKRTTGVQQLRKALGLCFLNNGLPQGTPISPMLTNLMMIPIDFKITNDMAHDNFVYTRYADDIQISSKFNFDWRAKCEYINGVLDEFNAPFKIKPEKTRYGSRSGRNWNLGVMLNKDNNITVGRKRKEQMKAMLFNYQRDRKSGVKWDPHDVQVMSGQLSYIKQVEPDYYREFIKWFNQKYSVNILRLIREDIGGK